ncbi:MAG: twin-arginine translocation signal domain-containing protein [Campylobacterota bacterium]|nr:twin-arginine translocation signal domain-containing protein [Campylobacterota bacterium]
MSLSRREFLKSSAAASAAAAIGMTGSSSYYG